MAQTTLERHLADRAAVEAAAGEKLNELAAIITAGQDAGHYPDGLTVNLSRALNLARVIGPMLAPPPVTDAEIEQP